MKTFLIILLIVFVIAYVSYPIIKYLSLKKDYKKVFDRKIKFLAKSKSIEMINNVNLSSYKGNIHVDNIVFGKKYIYLINDAYYPGTIIGDDKSNSWVYVDKNKGNVSYISNLLKNEEYLQAFSSVSKIDYSLLIHIYIVNNNLDLRVNNQKTNNSYIVKENKIYKLINTLEKEDVRSLDIEKLNEVVKDLKKLNEKGN